MNHLAYIICPNCGHQIGGGHNPSWTSIIMIGLGAAACIASKLITGRWIP